MSDKFVRRYTEEERVKIVEGALSCGSNSLVEAKYMAFQIIVLAI